MSWLTSRRAALAIYVAALAVNGIVVTFGFLYDDRWTIVENAFIRDLGNVSELLSDQYFEEVPDNNRPVMVLSTMIDYRIHALKPGGYHLQNLLWHALCSLLVLGLVRRVSGSLPIGASAALLFAVHPIHTEPIAAINYREDLLAGFFVLAGLVAALAGRERRRWSAVALACFVLGSFAKESALVAPLLLVICDAARAEPGELGTTLRRRAPEYVVAFVVLAALWVPFTLAFGGDYTSTSSGPAHPLDERLLTTARIGVAYLIQLAVPVTQSAEYVVDVTGAGDWRNWAALAICLGVLFAGLRAYRTHPVIAWGTAWIAIALLPVLNVVPIFNMRADRYLYLPSVGACAVGGVALVALGQRLRRGASTSGRKAARFVAPTAAVAILLAGLSLHRLPVWNDAASLWSDALEHAPESRRALAGATLAYATGDRPGDALRVAERGLRKFPNDPKLLMGRGIAHAELGDPDLALRDFEASLRVAPPKLRPRLHHNIGIAHARLGQHDRAEQAFRQALELVPNAHQSVFHLAKALEAQDKNAQALRMYRRAAALAPHDRESRQRIRALER